MPFEAIPVAGIGSMSDSDDQSLLGSRFRSIAELRIRRIEDVARDIATQYETVAARGGQIVASHTIHVPESRMPSWIVLVADCPASE